MYESCERIYNKSDEPIKPDDNKAGWAKQADELIKAGWAIKADDWIKAGWAIKADDWIKAGWAIKADESKAIVNVCVCERRVFKLSEFKMIEWWLTNAKTPSIYTSLLKNISFKLNIHWLVFK